MRNIIGLITDFGIKDHYVGVLKAVILSINPHIHFIDITHSVVPFNLMSASYLLYSSWDYFPEGTVFLSVIDPGVGTERDVIVYFKDNKYLVTPDNGIISLLMKRKTKAQAVKVSNETIEKIRIGSSDTFHGRDIFAPVAASITLGGLDSLKVENIKPVILDKIIPALNKEKCTLVGQIIHIDRFGNCISSIHLSDFKKLKQSSGCTITTLSLKLPKILRCFFDVSPGQPLAYWGSSGFLEIGIREDNASKVLNLKQGEKIIIEIKHTF